MARMGRSTCGPGAAVQAWLAAHTPEFRAGVEVVVIDPHAGYAAAVRAAPGADRGGPLPPDHAREQDRDRGAPARHPRAPRPPRPQGQPGCGPTAGCCCAGEGLSPAALARMWNGCVDHDPSGQILSVWIAKGGLRALCAHRGPRRAPQRDPRPALVVLPMVRRRRHPGADHPGRDDRDLLARGRGVPRDRDHERSNRGYEPVDQAGETGAFGFHNRDNYRRRVRLHCTGRTRRLSARRRCPPKIAEPLCPGVSFGNSGPPRRLLKLTCDEGSRIRHILWPARGSLVDNQMREVDERTSTPSMSISSLVVQQSLNSTPSMLVSRSIRFGA